MKPERYLDIKRALIDEGYAEEIDWQTNLEPVTNPITFRNEAIWVILNSGMKAQVARIIHTRIWQAYTSKQDISTAFGHKGKVNAIKYIMDNYPMLFQKYYDSIEKLEYLQTIPFIGSITKYHLAKNLGLDCIKPDRHLVRLAKTYKFEDCFEMCKCLSIETGDKVSVVDIVLWRAANLGMI